jgi:hypothetical protein
MKISLMALVAGFCLVVGLPLAATAGPTPGGPDTDADTIEDAFDNCVTDANPAQKDLDHDGCGDTCDCDFDNNGVCNAVDFAAFASTYLRPQFVGDPLYNPLADCNCDGVISAIDFACFAGGYLTVPCP